MTHEVTLPVLGESVTEGTVSRWLKNVGDTVARDEPLVEISTDKVDTEIPSPVEGIIAEICVQEDETVAVGALLAIVKEPVDSAPSPDLAAPPTPAPYVRDNAPFLADPIVEIPPETFGVPTPELEVETPVIPEFTMPDVPPPTPIPEPVEVPQVLEEVVPEVPQVAEEVVPEVPQVAEEVVPEVPQVAEEVVADLPPVIAEVVPDVPVIAEVPDPVLAITEPSVTPVSESVASVDAAQPIEVPQVADLAPTEPVQTVEDAKPESQSVPPAQSFDVPEVDMEASLPKIEFTEIAAETVPVSESVVPESAVLESPDAGADESSIEGIVDSAISATEVVDVVEHIDVEVPLSRDTVPTNTVPPISDMPTTWPPQPGLTSSEPAEHTAKGPSEDTAEVPEVTAEVPVEEAVAIPPTQAEGLDITPSPHVPVLAPHEIAEPIGTSVYVTPLVRKLADEKGVDLSAVAGSGVGGRVRKQDVLDAAEALANSPVEQDIPVAGQGIPPVEQSVDDQSPAVEETPGTEILVETPGTEIPLEAPGTEAPVEAAEALVEETSDVEQITNSATAGQSSQEIPTEEGSLVDQTGDQAEEEVFEGVVFEEFPATDTAEDHLGPEVLDEDSDEPRGEVLGLPAHHDETHVATFVAPVTDLPEISKQELLETGLAEAYTEVETDEDIASAQEVPEVQSVPVLNIPVLDVPVLEAPVEVPEGEAPIVVPEPEAEAQPPVVLKTPTVSEEDEALLEASTEEEEPQGPTTEKISRLRATIARRMVDSLHTSAQLTATVEVDLTLVSRLRSQVKDEFKARQGVSLTFLPFIAKAAMEALKAYPKVNATIDTDEGQIIYPNGEHLGIAVDTPRGLMVPVIRNAGDLSVVGLAKKIADISARTRHNQISVDDLQGGTFTITNYGSAGTLFDTPIVNQPQVAILGTGAIKRRPVVVDDSRLGEIIAIRDMMYLSLSYDHRLVDGADAARFLVMVKERLEDGDFGAEF